MANIFEIASVDAVPNNSVKAFVVNGIKIAVFNLGGKFYAIADTCSHEEASLSEGEIIGTQIECPRHGARFDITTGRNLTLPAVLPVKKYELKIEDGKIFVVM
ncbi:MAG: non-heme iron oxygenase ferredoxin subunit [candidate division KSB1 bacterium]|nr:non-heme iron oxygenase ferredoxin subunit [candidate division KSB1 bacterium]MDZ7304981.1 non-heme iron oxygenase ferredoxin subunit [candidate division KSB1 bacterium]MDZ7314024.1 non-heme iron oxygenase ferredoxin subunit [candidate division KSB1 bacterium]